MYLFGAVCPARGTAAGLVLPFVNTAAMNAHLAEIARTVAPGAHALLILDGAGWHGSNALVVPDNLSLLTLPPYSPDLNPVENVWAYLRANKLAISVFESYDDIVDACCNALEFLRQRPQGHSFHNLTVLCRGQLIGPLVTRPSASPNRAHSVTSKPRLRSSAWR